MVPASCSGCDPLLLGRRDVEREHRQHRAVHRHRHRHLVERDAVEEGAGVVDRVDRHARHADVAAHPRVVGVVAAVGGEVEGDAQPLLPGREVAAVERVGLLRGREAGVLPDRPRLRRVHRRVGPAQERRDARPGVEPVEALEVLGAVDREDVDPLRAAPRLSARWSSSPRGTSGRIETHLRRSSAGCSSAELLSHPAEEAERIDPHRARVVDVGRRSAPPACPPARRTTLLPRAAPRRGRRPTRRTPRRCRRGRRRAVLRRPRSPRRRQSVAPAASTATPPAANRLVAKVARAVCAAIGPIVARKTGRDAGSARRSS